MHALFDPDSDYSKFRSEFDPKAKVYGYFAAVQVIKRFEEETGKTLEEAIEEARKFNKCHDLDGVSQHGSYDRP